MLDLALDCAAWDSHVKLCVKQTLAPDEGISGVDEFGGIFKTFDKVVVYSFINLNVSASHCLSFLVTLACFDELDALVLMDWQLLLLVTLLAG